MVPGGGQSLTVSEAEGGGGGASKGGRVDEEGGDGCMGRKGRKQEVDESVCATESGGFLTSPPSAPRRPALLFPSADTLK